MTSLSVRTSRLPLLNTFFFLLYCNSLPVVQMKGCRWLSWEIWKLSYHFFDRLPLFSSPPLLNLAQVEFLIKVWPWKELLLHSEVPNQNGSPNQHPDWRVACTWRQRSWYTLKWWIQAGVSFYGNNWPIITINNFSGSTFCLCFYYRLHDNDYHCFYNPSLMFDRRKLLLIVLNGHYVKASSSLHQNC